MKTFHSLAFAAIAALALGAGCTSMTLGRQISRDQVKRIEVGRTTAKDLTSRFGKPYRTTNCDEGRILTYVYITPEGAYQKLTVGINADGVVSSCSLE